MLRRNPRFAWRTLLGVVVPLALVGCQGKSTSDDDTHESGGSAGSGSGAAAGSGSGGTAGGGSAGMAGSAAGTDTDAIPPGDPCATAVFCDDFESYATAPTAPWTARTTSGSVAIDTDPISGNKSVKLATTGGDSVTAMIRLQGAELFPVAGNVLYGRMLWKLDAAPTTSVHWTMIQGLGLVPGQTYHALYRYGGQQPIATGSQMMANYETPDWYSDKTTPGSDCWYHSNGSAVPEKYTKCIEWKFDGPANTMKLWINMDPRPDLTVVGHGDGCVNAPALSPWTAPTFTSIDLGWESYQTDTPRTVWIDDVVISTTRIGCPGGFPAP
jgi:hypothetical protein